MTQPTPPVPVNVPVPAPADPVKVTVTPLIKPWWKSKTILVVIGQLTVFGLTMVLQQAGVFHFSVELIAALGILSSMILAGLRLVTNTAIAGTPSASALLSKVGL